MKIHFFCVPKPWTPTFAQIQSAAIKSWLQIVPHSQITMLCDEPGTETHAREFNTNYIPAVQRNEWGTPLVSSIFETITRVATDDEIVCYINADIVLDHESFTRTINFVSNNANDEWLVVGKRTDVTVDTQRNPSDILQHARETGVDHGWDGIDYFVYKRPDLFRFVYPFALGKFVWDQWLLGNAYRRGVKTIDASATIFAVHLNCDWYFGGNTTRDRRLIENSEEAKRNKSFDTYQRNIQTGTTHHTTTAPHLTIEEKSVF